MSAEGKWKLTVKSPTGPMPSELVITSTNGQLSGVQSGQGESSDIDSIHVNGNEITWTNTIAKPMKMTLEFTGTIEGDEMTGKVKAGFMGKYPFSGTRA